MENADKGTAKQTPLDDLTGFELRKSLEFFLYNLLEHSSDSSDVFSIIMLDVDRFKKFNDKFGHPFGDKVLQYIASVLRLSSYEGESHIFRYGGDEFIIVLPAAGPKKAFQAMSRFKYAMARRPFLFKNKFLKVTTSSGIAVYPTDGRTVNELVKKADEAMYFSKHHGRNITTLASRIMTLRVAEVFGLLVIIFVILLIVYLGRDFLARNIIPAVTNVGRDLKISILSINNDTVELKNGMVMNGKIVRETHSMVFFRVNEPLTGITKMYEWQKSSISKIRYGLMTPSKRKYDEYKEKHPNPHE